MSRRNSPLPFPPSLDTYYKYERALLSLKKIAQFSSALTRKGNGKRQNLKVNIRKRKHISLVQEVYSGKAGICFH